MVTNTFLVGNKIKWWINNGISPQISGDQNSFEDYELVGDDMMMYMKNSSFAKVVGKGTVQLKFTSSKIVTLEDVLNVPNNSKNFASKALLSKYGSR